LADFWPLSLFACWPAGLLLPAHLRPCAPLQPLFSTFGCKYTIFPARLFRITANSRKLFPSQKF
jgi:hypothetical protein